MGCIAAENGDRVAHTDGGNGVIAIVYVSKYVLIYQDKVLELIPMDSFLVTLKVI